MTAPYLMNHLHMHVWTRAIMTSGDDKGDKGYARKRHLLTPFLNPQTPGKRACNHAHAVTRSTV